MHHASSKIPNKYYDSVFLMRVAKRISHQTGIRQAAAVMGSPGNIRILTNAGFSDIENLGATANDLVVCLQAETPAQAEAIFGSIEKWLQPEVAIDPNKTCRTLDEALRKQTQSNLAVISVPGEFAAREARAALAKDLNVFLFSDNVPISDEVALKQLAVDKGLLVMGPDCGTSIINGKGIGFANVVRRGPIGVIGASGTGIQEATTRIHNMGSGISHAMGIGSRDLSDQVGGISALQAIDALESDPATTVITLISKPPGEKTLSLIRDRIGRCAKPVVACFFGASRSEERDGQDVIEVNNLEDLVLDSVALANGNQQEKLGESAEIEVDALHERSLHTPHQRFVRGLFAGGTFCYQAQQVFAESGMNVRSNEPLDSEGQLVDSGRSEGNTLLDMGSDEFTAGRPHPMIDSSQRARRIIQEARDPEVAVILVDFLLGYGSSADPVGELSAALAEAKGLATQRGDHLTVVASICGTSDDPQRLDTQRSNLENLGAFVFSSAHTAARFACLAARRN